MYLSVRNRVVADRNNVKSSTKTAWYIPPSWIPTTQPPPTTILEAALLASRAALSTPGRQLAHSNIPLLIHQTGASSRVDTWKPGVVPWVEQWLQYAVSPPNDSVPMAYFFWDNEGIAMFMDEYEKDFVIDFRNVFTPVERADIFRVLACRYLGGVYADIDTQPLRPPATWIGPSDLARWTDDLTGKSYGLHNATTTTTTTQPVNLIWGLEADTDPSANAYWRMGYTYPVQLTQWALASVPGHPALGQFMDNLRAEVRLEKEEKEEKASVGLDSSSSSSRADPLTRTGPAAVTLATMQWLEKEVDFRWNSLTGLKDGGRAKLVQDMLILPITGFSPGRGTYGNMGSKPITHPDARLVHHALGSWRKFDWLVEYGKFCRTAFGLCRNWTKVVT
ncbi:glycosyltransferase family 32 protein [Trichoderma citrinoviride]|uniref:Glycosyltransferase family 32 protein n=1 Tax=Trichoderma citrinoviride TaxID=58853 RepID=A0A2T4B706_9HYPO|nr:glycosyltransferase family 32 protein [Trichoderma citrinoviride]PTB65107.1 glycosyltransferase family 32 protein [Trichoderma citrinoviride]